MKTQEHTPNPKFPRKTKSIVPRKKPGKDFHREYRTSIEIGFVLALGVLVLVLNAPIQNRPDAFEVDLVVQDIVQMEDIEQTKQEVRTPAPPRPPVPIEVPNDTYLEDDVLDLDASLDLDEPLAAMPPPPPPPSADEGEEEEIEIFVVVEEMPSIIGGQARLYEVIEYPEVARLAGIEGLAIVQLVVEPNGTPSNLSIMRSAGDALDEAALAGVAKLTFNPGKQRGQAVRVQMAIPVRFKLKNQKPI